MWILPLLLTPQALEPTPATPLQLTALASAQTDPADDPHNAVYRYGEHDERSYLRGAAGLVTTRSSDGPGEEVDFDEGWSLDLVYGRNFDVSADGSTRWSWELEGYYSDQDIDHSGPTQAVRDVNIAAVFANLAGEWALNDSLAATAGVGLGVGWVSVGKDGDALQDFDEEDGPSLAWQAKAGLLWGVSSTTSLYLGYRFLNVDDVELDENGGDASFDLQTEQHVLELGLQLRL